MNWADWAILAILGISVLISVMRGFVREAMSLVVWISALFVATWLYQDLASWLVEIIVTASLRLLAAWLALFVVVLITGGLINYLLSKMIQATGLSGTDRFFGIFFGAARGAIVVLAILIMVPQILPIDQDNWWHESQLIPEFLRFEGWARLAASSVIDFFDRLF
jgi:membrane protein required for colicin V production